jgi:hypothetical protein
MPMPNAGAARPMPKPGGNPLAALGGAGKLPGAITGGPSGPGASPVTSPGDGAGSEAAADAMIQALMPALHKALTAYQVGGKKYIAVTRAITALAANFGKSNQQSMVPAALLQMAQAGKTGQAMGGATPPPSIAPAAGAAAGGPPAGGGMDAMAA